MRNSMYVLSLMAGTVIAAPPAAGQAMAQDVTVMASASWQESRRSQKTGETTNPLRVPVDVSIAGQQLSDAVETIARVSGIRVVYSPTLLPANKVVSLSAKSMELGTALERLLVGTGIQPRLVGATEVVLVRNAGEARVLQGIIVGRVLHAKTKTPIAGAMVSLDEANRGVTTGSDGTFRLTAAPGEHTVHVRAVGMGRQSKVVTMEVDKTVTIEFVVEPNASVLGEVVVTGSVIATERKTIPTPITVIDADYIEKRGITNVEQLFRGEVPGLFAADQGIRKFIDEAGTKASTQLYSRGSSDLGGGANPIKTYVDGVELLDPSYLGTLDPRHIERIEIITGPQAATMYGSGAMGGVMQIFTKKGNGSGTPDLTLSMRYGMLESNMSNGFTPSHNHSFNLLGGTGPDFSYSGSASYSYLGQWQPFLFDRTYGASLGLTHTQGALKLSGSMSVTSGKNGTIPAGNVGQPEVQAPYYRAKIESGEHYAWKQPTSFFTQRISYASSQVFSLATDYAPFSVWQHHLTVGRSQNTFTVVPDVPNFATPGDTLFQSDTRHGARTTVSYNMTLLAKMSSVLTSHVTLGGNGSQGNQNSIQGCLSGRDSRTLVDCGSRSIAVNTTLSDESWGGFGTWQLGVFDQVFLTLGIRGERNPSYGREHKVDWTPTNGVTYTFERNNIAVKLLASYGRSTKPPTSEMRDAVLSTSPLYVPAQYLSQLEAPFLRPQAEAGPQGGVEIYIGNLGSITVNHYQQKVRDMIQSLVVDSIERLNLSNNTTSYVRQYQYVNVGLIRKLGWEATGAVNLGALSLKTTYSWNDSRLLEANPGVSYDGGRMFVNGTPSHFGNVTASYAHRGTSVTVVNNWFGKALKNNSWALTGATYLDIGIGGFAREVMYVQRIKTIPNLRADPGYMKSDVIIQQRLSHWAAFTLNIMNVGNSSGADLGVVWPSLGRQTTFGLSLRFPPNR